MHKVHFITALCTAAIGVAVVSPTAYGDEHDKKTVVTITEPLEVPGAVLQPGKYVFKLVESSNDRHIVIIKNERQNHTYATIFAIPNYKVKRTGKTEISFWETPAGQPRALRAWFYPGDNFGQEFMYPKTRVTVINQVARQQVPEAPADIQPPAEAETTVAENTPPPAPVEIARAEPSPAPAPAPEPVAAAPAPAPAPVALADNTPAPAELPQTGSDLPLFALFGFGAIALATGVRAFSKRME
jgi:LPXTG-motif cell wall-anchored protein